MTAAAAAALAGCGGSRARGGGGEPFRCRERRAMYVLSGSLLWQEQTVRLHCEGDVPRLERTFVPAKGETKRQDGAISEESWERAWTELNASGWRLLEDCENPAAGDKDPVYTFEIADGQKAVTFLCQGQELPFPYDRVRNALDLAAAELPGEGED